LLSSASGNKKAAGRGLLDCGGRPKAVPANFLLLRKISKAKVGYTGQHDNIPLASVNWQIKRVST